MAINLFEVPPICQNTIGISWHETAWPASTSKKKACAFQDGIHPPLFSRIASTIARALASLIALFREIPNLLARSATFLSSCGQSVQETLTNLFKYLFPANKPMSKIYGKPKLTPAALISRPSEWADLPSDLLHAIAQKISVRAPLRLVCKTWCSQLSTPIEQMSTLRWDSSFATSFPNLKILEFRRNSIQGLGNLSTLTHLRHLYLLDLSHQLDVDDGALKIAGKLAKLKVLKLNNCPNISDVGLSNLSRGPLPSSLRQLDLSFCQRITDDGIANLGNSIGSLSHLNLKLCLNVEGWGLHGFVDSTASLVGLDLSYSSTLRKFRDLTLHRESIFSAYPYKNFSHPVEGLTSLKVLNLSFSDVTDELISGVASHLTQLIS